MLIASRDARDGALSIHQDVDVYAGQLAQGSAVKHELRAGRIGWLQVARGKVTLNGFELATGDGAAIEKETGIVLELATSTEILLFDMPE